MNRLNSQKGIAPFIVIFVFAVVLAGVGGAYYLKQQQEKNPPVLDETASWKTYINEAYGFEFKYPSGFFWDVSGFEPKITPIDREYANFSEGCPYIIVDGFRSEKKQALDSGFYTIQPVTINDIPYCHWKGSSGAAGSFLEEYYYSTVKDEKSFVVSFTIHYTNCAIFFSEEESLKKCEYANNVITPSILKDILSTFKFTQ